MPPITKYADITVQPAHELHYTEQQDFFASLDTDSLQINYTKLGNCLHNPQFVDHWPAMQLSRQLIEDALKERGIEITTRKPENI